MELANVSAFKKVRYRCHHLSITLKNREKLYRYSSKGEDPIIITFDFEIDYVILFPVRQTFLIIFFQVSCINGLYLLNLHGVGERGQVVISIHIIASILCRLLRTGNH